MPTLEFSPSKKFKKGGVSEVLGRNRKDPPELAESVDEFEEVPSTSFGAGVYRTAEIHVDHFERGKGLRKMF